MELLPCRVRKGELHGVVLCLTQQQLVLMRSLSEQVLSYLSLIDGSCSVSLQCFQCLLPLNSTSQTAWAADCLASRSMPFDTHMLLPLFFLAPVAFVAGLCLTTLARLPSGLAWAEYGRHRLSSELLVHLYSCPYSDTILLSAVIWIFVLYLFASCLVGVVVVYICSFGFYRELL